MSQHAFSIRRIWAWPLVLAVLTALSLIAALFEDEGLLDVFCALIMSLLVLICLWHGCLARWLKRR